MTEGQTPLWLRRTVVAGLLGGLLLVGFVVMRPFLSAIAWAAILTYVSRGRCIYACWRGCAAAGPGLHWP